MVARQYRIGNVSKELIKPPRNQDEEHTSYGSNINPVNQYILGRHSHLELDMTTTEPRRAVQTFTTSTEPAKAIKT